MPGVFPDYPAPVIRNGDNGEREMAMMRWGMPPPPRTAGPHVTDIRNTSSPHWRAWLKPAHRCLVPANSFAEYAPEERLAKHGEVEDRKKKPAANCSARAEPDFFDDTILPVFCPTRQPFLR
jgi:putative SOS response-associated peptidase YedK